MPISSELQSGLDAYYKRVADLGGYGATITASTLGYRATAVTGTLEEAGYGGCQPCVLTSDGRRWRIDLDTARAV